MKLRVSPRQGMWGFGPLWITFADPKPTEVELSKLDSQTREAINVALAQRALIEVDDEDEPIVIPEATQTVQRPVVAKPKGLLVSPMIERKLRDLLQNGVTTLRREIPLIKSQPMLSTALQLEKTTKNRKTVISLLEKQIETIGSIRAGQNMYDDLIKEEENREITIKIEDMTIHSIDKDEQVEDEEELKKKMKEY